MQTIATPEQAFLQVLAIRELRGKRKTADIASEYGVSQSLISHIQTGRIWKRL